MPLSVSVYQQHFSTVTGLSWVSQKHMGTFQASSPFGHIYQSTDGQYDRKCAQNVMLD